ncbi:MAG: hypothetical protein ACYTGB_10160 [Planctomycetota bacterium]
MPAVALGGEQPPPRFTRKPTATRTNGKVRIEFAVDRETDVAVFVDGADGKVVRHLVAGVLGKNPPSPLKPGLAQSITWDGKADYGREAKGGPFKARVALGVGAKYDKVLISNYQSIKGVSSLGVGPDGTVYCITTQGGSAWSGPQILAYNRDGTYKRSVTPFSTDHPEDKVKAFGVFQRHDRPAPLVHSHRLGLTPMPSPPRKSVMAVTPDGKALLWLTGGTRFHRTVRISAVGTDSSAIWPHPSSPGFMQSTTSSGGKARAESYSIRPMLAISSDGKHAYVSGLRAKYNGKTVIPAVYRAPLPSRGPAELFFGHESKTGKDSAHLGGNAPGLAVDGKGHLLISDPANDRVMVISEADGKCVGEMKVQKPDCLGANPRTGEIYVLRRTGKYVIQLAKFSSWKTSTPSAVLPVHFSGNASFPPVMALDANAPRPLVWIGSESSGLQRIQDLGGKFGDARTVTTRKDADCSFLDLSVDHHRKEVYARVARAVGGFKYSWFRYSETEGKTSRVGLNVLRASGAQLVPGPDGNLYASGYPSQLYKHDRNGKPLSWSEGGFPEKTLDKRGRISPLKTVKQKHMTYAAVSMTWMTHTLGVRHDGHLFLLEPIHPGGRPTKALHEYLPTGRKLSKDPIIWQVSDGAVGPKFDQQGNIYIAEIVKPLGQPYPAEFKKIFPKLEMNKTRPRAGTPQDNTANMYGSIVKFSPEGGMIHLSERQAFDYPYRGKPKLNGHKPVDASYYSSTKYKPVKVSGAEWIAPGYSHVEIRSCNCETTRFDVDEFGRVWYPDLNLFQVRVVDTNGNPITRFGGYGNAESRGPDSLVVDAKTGRLRPPKNGEKSPFAKPEIAFSWLVGVGVTDDHIYTGDSLNRRMMRLKIVYSAQETCAIR